MKLMNFCPQRDSTWRLQLVEISSIQSSYYFFTDIAFRFGVMVLESHQRINTLMKTSDS